MRVEEVLTIVLVTLLIALLGFLVIEAFYTEPFNISGVVVGLEYTPSTINTGTGFNSEGGVTIITTGKDEEWTVVLKQGEAINTYEIKPNIFYSLEIGQTATIPCEKGIFAGTISCY